MVVESPPAFYEGVMKAVQEQADKWLPPNKRYKFSIEVYCTKKHGDWVVNLKKK